MEKIDREITIQLDKLNCIIDNLDFQEVITFKLAELQGELPLEQYKFKGIYFFEIMNDGESDSFEVWLNEFIKLWEAEPYLGKSTPNIYVSRCKAHKEFNQWVPLYIGKSKEVGKRISEHIFMELNKSTYAMKLMARKNLAHETIRVSIIKMGVDNYDTILPVIEKGLRERFNPIVGKQ